MKWIEYSLAGVAFLLPTSTPYYEVVIEVLNSISKLIPRFSLMAVNYNQSSRFFLLETANFLSNIELVLEKIGLSFSNPSIYFDIIFFVELIKACCRSGILLSSKPVCFVNWLKNDSLDSLHQIDLSHYCEFYSHQYLCTLGKRVNIDWIEKYWNTIRNDVQNDISYFIQHGNLISSSSSFVGQKLVDVPFIRNPHGMLLIGEFLYITRPVLYSYWTKRIRNISIVQSKEQDDRNDESSVSIRDKYSFVPSAKVLDASIPLLICLLFEIISIGLSSCVLQQSQRYSFSLMKKHAVNMLALFPRNLANACVCDVDVHSTARPTCSNYNCLDHSTISFNSCELRHPYDEEMKRRKLCLLLYLLKSPLFDRATIPAVKSTLAWTSQIPGLKSLKLYDSLVSLLTYFHETHFYNSNS